VQIFMQKIQNLPNHLLHQKFQKNYGIKKVHLHIYFFILE